ncbi:ER membrane protein [Histoplasma capsulatum var. duboisii H88]|uniref:ER membrane protein n=2 Tax=Ajellomyces capsulatus TaxID=5037 RepID=A0A8A1LG42_AJEC8|nr:ER membrane protein Wsc4 [Histoplasma capsulatum H143]QSS53358.1 ER membrane protein [Histoplasma capsulatum var. duboisii H88]
MALGSNFVAISYLFAFLHTIIPTIAVSLDYCSSVNTGSNFDSVLSIFQSTGACRITCADKYAVAILQGKSCWCSNNVPGGTYPQSACSEPCPGYPSEMCGNSQEGLFGYLLLKKPSQTIGQVTQTPLSSSTSTSTATATSGVSTSSGAIITQTLPPGAGQTGGTTSSSSISGGAIAGIVIGTLLAIGLIISVILWLFCVRRHRENDTKIDVNGYEPPAPTPSFHSAIQSPPMTYQGGMSMNGGAIGTNDRYRLNVPGFTDSRMKKDVVIYPNGDRQSNISLQDNQDYSRPVLRLTNPDP